MKKTFILLLFSLFAFISVVHAQFRQISAMKFHTEIAPGMYDDDVKCVFLMYSNDCQYSLQVYRSLDELSSEFPDVPFYAICVDNDMWVFDRYNMNGVPTYGFVNYSDSQMYSGVFTKSEFRRKLQQMFR